MTTEHKQHEMMNSPECAKYFMNNGTDPQSLDHLTIQQCERVCLFVITLFISVANVALNTLILTVHKVNKRQ